MRTSVSSLTLHDGNVLLRAPYDESLDIRAHVPGARWLKSAEGWLCPLAHAAAAVALAAKLKAEIHPIVLAAVAKQDVEAERHLIRGKERMAAAGESYYTYQPRGVKFLAGRKSAILAWGMRTGKTVVSLTAVPPHAPLIVAAPGSALYQWKAEIEKYLGYGVIVHRGRKRFPIPGPDTAVVTTWASLPPPETRGNMTAARRDLAPGTVVIGDECHKAKNPRAARTHAMRSLARGAVRCGGRAWGLTGTPIQNHPLELWHLFNTFWLAEEAFDSWARFLDLFNANVGKTPIEFGDPGPEVPERVRRVMDRMTFAEAAPWLPTPKPRFLPIDIDAPRAKRLEWETAFEHFHEAYDAGRRIDGGWELARKDLSEAKVKASRQAMDDLIEAGGGPLIVFSPYVAPVVELGSQRGWGCIHGGTPMKERERLRQLFQTGGLIGLALTLGSGAEALTLDRAETVVFLDLSFLPGDNQQAMARAMSVRRKYPPNVFVLVASGTVDFRVNEICARKSRLEQAVLRDRLPPPRRVV